MPSEQTLQEAVLKCLNDGTGSIQLVGYRQVQGKNELVADIVFSDVTWRSKIYDRQVTFSGKGFAQMDFFVDGRMRLFMVGLSAAGVDEPNFNSCDVIVPN